MAAAAHLGRRIGTAVKQKIGSKPVPWHDSLMAAASRAIAERIPLVDLIVHVRDARVTTHSLTTLLLFPRISITLFNFQIPLSSECHLLRNQLAPSNQI